MGKTAAIIIARLIFAGVFAMAAGFKFAGMQDTGNYIAAAGFPFPLALAWIAAVFEVALVIGFLTGAFFREAALLAAIYVIFLAFAFHGPSHWKGNQAEFGFFVDHFTFFAGLLFAAVHGPGEKLAVRCCDLSGSSVFMKKGRSLLQPSFLKNRLSTQFIVGMTNSAPSLMPDGQREVTVLVLV